MITEAVAASSSAGQRWPEGHPRRWYALVVLCLALCMVVLDNTILTVAIPSIARDLRASEADLQWVTTAYGVVLAGLLLPLAVVGDRRGRKGLFIAGLVIFGTASGTAATATSALALTVCRGAMGIGGACAMPATLSLLGNIFPEHERNQALAIWTGVAGLAAAAGPLGGGLLLSRFWWGSVFLVNVPVAAVTLIGALVLVPRSTDPTSPRLDRRSSMIWWVALTAAVVAIIEAPVRGWSSPIVLGAAAAAAALFGAFRYNERRSGGPLIDAATTADPRFRWGVATMAALFFAAYGFQFVVTQWVQGPQKRDALVAGLVFLPSAAGSVACSLGNPRWVRRFGHGPVVSVGLLAMGSGALVGALAVVLGSVGLLALGAGLVGIGMGTASTSGAELIMSSASPARAGSVAGVNETVVEAAGALGVAALGSLLAGGLGYAWPLPLAAVATGACAVGAWRRLRPA